MILLYHKLVLILAVVAAMLILSHINKNKGIVMRSQWFRVLSRGSLAA